LNRIRSPWPRKLRRALQRLQQFAGTARRADPYRRRAHVIRRLGHVDVIIRVNGRILPFGPPEQLDRPLAMTSLRSCCGRAGAGLVHVHNEPVPEAAAQDLVARGRDGVRLPRIEQAQFLVDPGGRSFDVHRRVDVCRLRFQAADREIFKGACVLNAIYRRRQGSDRSPSESFSVRVCIPVLLIKMDTGEREIKGLLN